MMWSQRYHKLKTLLARGKLVVPAEQTEKVLPGNGVRVRYEDGVTEHYILEGYLIKPVPNRVSYLSPLGKALSNATRGSRVAFSGAVGQYHWWLRKYSLRQHFARSQNSTKDSLLQVGPPLSDGLISGVPREFFSYRLNTGSSHRPQLAPFRSDAFSTISSSVLTPVTSTV